MGSIDTKQEKLVPYVPDYDEWYQHFKDLRDGYVQPDHMGRYVVGTGKRNRKLKELEVREKEACEKEIALSKLQRPVVNQITPVAQALEMAKSEIQRKHKKNEQATMTDGQKMPKKYKASVDRNSFRYLTMNSKQLHDMLLGYPVTICTADQLKIERGRFVISNTDTSQGPGQHWVTFFSKTWAFRIFQLLGTHARLL